MSISDEDLVRAMELHEQDPFSLSNDDDILNAAMDLHDLQQIYGHTRQETEGLSA